MRMRTSIAKPGVYSFTPELGENEPDAVIKARLGYYGTHYFIDTPLTLAGRGITERPAVWCKGCREDVEQWKSYIVTKRAFEKLSKEYSISMVRYLD